MAEVIDCWSRIRMRDIFADNASDALLYFCMRLVERFNSEKSARGCVLAISRI